MLKLNLRDMKMDLTPIRMGLSSTVTKAVDCIVQDVVTVLEEFLVITHHFMQRYRLNCLDIHILPFCVKLLQLRS